MKFIEKKGETTSDELVDIIEYNNKLAAQIRSISSLEECSKKIEIPQETKAEIVEEFDVDFEEKVSFCKNNYSNLSDNFTSEDLLAILPSMDDKEFRRLLLRLSAESTKEMKELYELLNDTTQKEECEEIARLIMLEKRKRDMINSIIKGTCKNSISSNTQYKQYIKGGK